MVHSVPWNWNPSIYRITLLGNKDYGEKVSAREGTIDGD